MPEFVRAYIVVVALSFFIFFLLRRLNIGFIHNSEIKLWRNYWLAVTTISFFSPNIWIYTFFIVLLFSYATTSNIDRLALFIAVVCASPLFRFTIPGFGLINFLIVFSYVNILTLLVLVPEYRQHKGRFKFPPNKFDKLVVFYVVVICLLNFRDNTVTNSIREGINYGITILLPYYLISRLISDAQTLKRVLFLMLFCIAPLALIGTFESLKHWKLYSSSIAHVLEYSKGTDYGIRGDSLRASALFVGPLTLGYVMTVGIGLTLFIKNYSNKKTLVNLLVLCFAACLYFTKARGSWVGFLVLAILYIWSGPQKLGNLAKFSFSGFFFLGILSLTSVGQRIINSLPFISPESSHEASTVDYRFRLLEQSWMVFKKHPLFGTPNYRETPEMEVMRQGQGIIDVVNSYVHIGLSYGLVGLSLFSLIFFGLLFSILKSLKALPDDETDLINVGRALFAILGSILVMIMTVSSIDYIPVFYWIIAGFSCAYIKMCQHERQSNFTS